VWAFMSRPDADLDGFARLHGVDAALSQHASVKEGIAGTIGEFDEAESLLGAEPLDDPPNWRAGGCLEPRFAEPGSSSEGTGLCVVGLNVEVATPRVTGILISQLWFLGGWWPIRSVARDGMPSRVTGGICI
jgi:hypothetical protein